MRLLLFLLLSLSISHLSLAEPCYNESPFKTKDLQAVAKKTCQQMVESNQCQSLYASVKANGEDPELKRLKCDQKDDEFRRYENAIDYVLGCKMGGWNFVKDTFKTLGTAIGEGAAEFVISSEAEMAENKLCDSDPKLKAELYKRYNQGLPKILKVQKPEEKKLKSQSCALVKMDLHRHTLEDTKNIGMMIINKRMTNKKLTADEKEFQAWMDGRKNGANKTNLIDAAVARLKELGIQLDCYNTRSRAALVCESIASIVGFSAGTSGAAIGLARVKNIAKISGLSQSKLVSVARVRLNTHIVGVKTEAVSQLQKKVDEQDDKSEEAGK